MYVFRWPVWAYAGRPDQITRPLQVWPVDGGCFVRVADSLRARFSTLQCSAWGEDAGEHCLPPRLRVHRHHGPLRRVKRIYLLRVHDTRTSSSGGNFRCDRKGIYALFATFSKLNPSVSWVFRSAHLSKVSQIQKYQWMGVSLILTKKVKEKSL